MSYLTVENSVNARIGSKEWTIFRAGDFITGYVPTLGGEVVLKKGGPTLYPNADDARQVAGEIRESCREIVSPDTS